MGTWGNWRYKIGHINKLIYLVGQPGWSYGRWGLESFTGLFYALFLPFNFFVFFMIGFLRIILFICELSSGWIHQT